MKKGIGMKKITRRSFLQASGLLAAAALTACGNTSTDTSTANPADSGHPTITMNAPYRNMSAFSDLVHEKYPEINLEIIPYNGQNTTAYMKDMRLSKCMTDIYCTTYYTPGRYDDEGDFLDISRYDFMDCFAQSRLQEVTWNGGIYMLPLSYNALGITYNKTLLDAHGWTLPTNLAELEALKGPVEAAGCVFARVQLQYPAYGFQYLCNIADTGFLNTVDGLAWQEAFLRGEATVAGTPALVENLQLLNRWREIGMLNAEGTPMDDSETKKFVAEGNTLFLLGNSNDLAEKTDASDVYRLMPYLSEDGTQNVFILNISRFIGLSKALGEPGNEKKLADALRIMELIATEEGLRTLDPVTKDSRLLPLKDYTVTESSYYIDVQDDLNNGHTANYIYSGWENLAPVLGEKVNDFIAGDAELDDVIECFDANQHLVTDNTVPYYTTVPETIDTEDCAKLVGIALGRAVGAQAALISVNCWNYNLNSKHMNAHGVSGCLFPLPVGDEELVSILPTGWRGTIHTITMTGAELKALAAAGLDEYGNGNPFPYVLVTKGDAALNDSERYTVPVCGVTDAVKDAADYQDTGILGLDALRDYVSQFETLQAEEIVWE